VYIWILFLFKKNLASVSKSVWQVTRTSQIIQLATTYLFISAIQILWNRIKVNSHRDVDLFDWNTKSRATSMIPSSVFFFKGAIGEGWFVGSMIFLMVCIWWLDFYFLIQSCDTSCFNTSYFLLGVYVSPLRETPKSISTGSQYVTLDNKIKCLSLAVLFFATPPIKL